MARYDTGSVRPLDDEGWLLNPASELPLRVRGCSADAAVALKSALETGFSLARAGESAVLKLWSSTPQLVCDEVDSFIRRLRELYESARDRLDNQSSGLWSIKNGRSHPWHYDDFRSLGGEMFRYVADIDSNDPSVQRRLRAHLLVLGYTLGAYAAHRRQQRLERAPHIRGWRFMRMPAGCCPDCAMPEELPGQPWPIVPRHVACACAVFPVTS
jgi:hypothetical protein